MAKDTKDRILTAALEQFSKNGYAGTNIRELTASLGLAKSAMYRHFESKEAIWNALLDEMITYYAARFGSTEHLPPAGVIAADFGEDLSWEYLSYVRTSRPMDCADRDPLWKLRRSDRTQ